MVSSGLLRRVVTTQKTPFFIVTAVKTSNLTSVLMFKSYPEEGRTYMDGAMTLMIPYG
jgi:hypothetical protein